MTTILHILLPLALVGSLVNLAVAIGVLRRVVAEDADIEVHTQKARRRAEALRRWIRKGARLS